MANPKHLALECLDSIEHEMQLTSTNTFPPLRELLRTLIENHMPDNAPGDPGQDHPQPQGGQLMHPFNKIARRVPTPVADAMREDLAQIKEDTSMPNLLAETLDALENSTKQLNALDSCQRALVDQVDSDCEEMLRNALALPFAGKARVALAQAKELMMKHMSSSVTKPEAPDKITLYVDEHGEAMCPDCGQPLRADVIERSTVPFTVEDGCEHYETRGGDSYVVELACSSCTWTMDVEELAVEYKPWPSNYSSKCGSHWITRSGDGGCASDVRGSKEAD